jgi:hypothetical protein
MSMPNLAILCIEPYERTDVTASFRTAFHGVTLPSVKELNIRYVPDAAFILRACPKIETFITTYPDRQWKKTLRILPSMTSLRSVTVDAHSGFNWTHKRLSGNVPRSNIGVQELTRTRGPRISTRLCGAMLHGKPLQD